VIGHRAQQLVNSGIFLLLLIKDHLKIPDLDLGIWEKEEVRNENEKEMIERSNVKQKKKKGSKRKNHQEEESRINKNQEKVMTFLFNFLQFSSIFFNF